MVGGGFTFQAADEHAILEIAQAWGCKDCLQRVGIDETSGRAVCHGRGVHAAIAAMIMAFMCDGSAYKESKNNLHSFRN